MKLDNGETEAAYWRLDGRQDPAADEYNLSPCFTTHNTRKDGCIDERSEKKSYGMASWTRLPP
jgi:hypothetical protein